MRVIAGALKGRRLTAPRGAGLRPTSDKLRETLFNILARRIEGAAFLDGFAGTGAIGIEALSRGARHVTFVERDGRAAALIAHNLEACGIRGRYSIIRSSLTRAVKDLAGQRFDIIVLDPPYDAPDLSRVVAEVESLLTLDDGLVVLERARRRMVPNVAGSLTQVREVRSGDSAVTFYQAAKKPRPECGV